MTTPIAIFASGRGSNFDAVQSAVQRGELDAKIVALVSDQPGAPVLAKAKSAGVPTIVVPKPSGSGDTARAAHERAILEKLAPLDPHFIVLAGYMRIMTSTLIEAFRSERGHSRIVNVHPSILPAFPGVNAYEQAFRYGCKVAGVTVHLVEKEVDSGPILA
ncbi:MAG: phosphoribosylglycinamide formyltransferase, partial [Bdellovibrionota bacterium]